MRNHMSDHDKLTTTVFAPINHQSNINLVGVSIRSLLRIVAVLSLAKGRARRQCHG
jgi:hypothetical protein